jgi:hypothetical protein
MKGAHRAAVELDFALRNPSHTGLASLGLSYLLILTANSLETGPI